jgi:hypothetical protein
LPARTPEHLNTERLNTQTPEPQATLRSYARLAIIRSEGLT